MNEPTRYRRVLVGAILTALVATLAPSLAHAQSADRFIRAFDSDRTPIMDLTTEDFVIEHDGIEVEIQSVELIDRPLRVALLVDDADGAEPFFRNFRDGLPEFVKALPADAEVALVLLSGRPRVVVDYTDARDELMDALDSFFIDDSRAASFFPGLVETIDRWDEDVRFPVLAVVTTDGPAQRNVTDGRYDRLLETIRDRTVTIHALGLFTEHGQGYQTGIASTVTQRSGGWYDTLNGPSQSVVTKLTEMAAEIVRQHNETRYQYAVVYDLPPGADPDASIGAAVRRPGVGLIVSADGRPRPRAPTVASNGGNVGNSREELFNAGEAAFASGDSAQAAEWYQKANAADDEWGKPLFKLALVALNTGDIEAALGYLDQVMEVDPDSAEGAQAAAMLAQLRP